MNLGRPVPRFQDIWPLPYVQVRRLAPLVARGSQPAHTRPRLRRWRPRDTGRNAPLTRGASLQRVPALPHFHSFRIVQERSERVS